MSVFRILLDECSLLHTQSSPGHGDHLRVHLLTELPLLGFTQQCSRFFAQGSLLLVLRTIFGVIRSDPSKSPTVLSLQPQYKPLIYVIGLCSLEVSLYSMNSAWKIS